LSISPFRVFLLLVCLPVFLQGVPKAEKSEGKGIWARGQTVFLFTKVRPCIEESEIPSAQILVSTDGGWSWTKRGPRIEGSDFEFLYERKGEVWIAGSHTAEFGADPFILVPTSLFNWNRYTIHEGPSYLERIAFQKKSQLIARVRHINTFDENWKEYIHKSVDGGRSWSLVGPGTKRGGEPGVVFKRLGRKIPTWRIVDESDGGFTVQHLERGAWRTVSSFPSTPCPGDRP